MARRRLALMPNGAATSASGRHRCASSWVSSRNAKQSFASKAASEPVAGRLQPRPAPWGSHRTAATKAATASSPRPARRRTTSSSAAARRWASRRPTASCADSAVRPLLGSVRTKCPTMRSAAAEDLQARSMSSTAIHRVVAGCRSSHSQISSSRWLPKSLMLSCTAGRDRSFSIALIKDTFRESKRQVLESTTAAPVLRMMHSNSAQQLGRNTSSPRRECRTPSMSKKTTAAPPASKLTRGGALVVSSPSVLGATVGFANSLQKSRSSANSWNADRMCAWPAASARKPRSCKAGDWILRTVSRTTAAEALGGRPARSMSASFSSSRKAACRQYASRKARSNAHASSVESRVRWRIFSKFSGRSAFVAPSVNIVRYLPEAPSQLRTTTAAPFKARPASLLRPRTSQSSPRSSAAGPNVPKSSTSASRCSRSAAAPPPDLARSRCQARLTP
mmetsp:Transcript_108014/g.312117  ORF Transcript_108014/g.312117 Transcript_108014/m.312117 type:complete len:450 (-) Transcript_108014:455-1804(-)